MTRHGSVPPCAPGTALRAMTPRVPIFIVHVDNLPLGGSSHRGDGPIARQSILLHEA